MSTLVKARCFCGLNQFKVAFPTAELPLPTSICNCNDCRHSTGKTSAIYATLQCPPLSLDATEDDMKPANLSNLMVYHSSPNSSRRFCSKCFAQMFFKDIDKEQKTRWEVSAGALEEKVDEIVGIRGHIFVGSTLDGGSANHYLAKPSGETLPRYKEWTASGEPLPLDWKDPTISTSRAPKDVLHFHCHCKRIKFYLKRSTEIKNTDEEWYHVAGQTPDEPILFRTEHCVCTSCRLTSGSLVTTWTYIPRYNSLFLDPEATIAFDPADPAKRPKDLHQFESSPNIVREYCGTCGAAVFWYKNGDDEKMDIATGLVDQEDGGGARAEGWLVWEHDVSYKEDANSKQVLKMLEDGLKAAAKETSN